MKSITIDRRAGARASVVLLAGALLLAGPLAHHAEAWTDSQARMRTLINNERVSRGKPKVKLSDALNSIATRHSRNMAASGSLYHNSRLARQVSNTGMDWRILGENVGVGNSVSSLHKAFMNSDAHRRNILDRRFRKVGIGVVNSGGRVWITVVFFG